MRRKPILLLAALAGFSVPVVAGIAAASTTTLSLATGKVTNQSGSSSQEKIAVDSHGSAVYTLSGDSASHQKCTAANQCFSFWPPVKVQSAKHLTKPAGIKGKLGVLRRDGFLQLTLSGHPLYKFSGDKHRDAAVGEGIHGFGGIWHVVSEGAVHSGSGSTTSGSTTSTGTTSTTTTTMPGGTTTTTCAYPPYCY